MMIIHGTNIKYIQAPLPFIGQKRFWIKDYCDLILSLPAYSRIFDAFGGSGLLARLAKDTRPDLTVTTTDLDDQYKSRLELVDDTNEILNEMRAAGGYRDDDRYERYSREVEEKLVKIAEKAKDKVTVNCNLYVKESKTIRAKLRTVDYDKNLCEHWYDGLNRINTPITPETYKQNEYDIYILDPPYYNTKKKFKYNGNACSAQQYCERVITSGEKYILFEEYDSPLVSLTLKSHFDIKRRNTLHKATNSNAHDCMIWNFYG